MADKDGAGARANRAKKKRWRLYQGAYMLAATALMGVLVTGRGDPDLGHQFTPVASLTGAVLLPLLTLVTMTVTLRMSDEVQRAIIVRAWAVGLIATMFLSISWLFLIGGGLVAEPAGSIALVALAGMGGLFTVLGAIWFQWRQS